MTNGTMTRLFLPLRVLAALAVLAAPAMAQDREASAAPMVPFAPDPAAVAAYKLGSGDRVKVTVFRENDLSGTFEVSSTETISVPLIGEVKVGGMTMREVEGEVSRRFLDGYLKDPKVSVEVVNYRPFYIIGEVHRPGSYAYVNGMSVLNAVALGGGFTHRAREQEVYLTRGNDPTKAEKLVEATTIIMPGDVIRVAERFF
jgi:protein involved in polysaccharide export with SLBB domain